MTFAATYIKFTKMSAVKIQWQSNRKDIITDVTLTVDKSFYQLSITLAVAPVKSYLMKWSTYEANGFSKVHTFRTDVAMRRAIAIEVRKASIIITVIKTEAAWRWFISWWKMNDEITNSVAWYCTKWHQHVAENIPVHLCWHKDHFHQLQQLKDHGQSNQLST